MGSFLFTITTDNLTHGIDYEADDLNCARHRQEQDEERDSFPIDLSLARIVGDQDSAYGIDNITIEMEERVHLTPFHMNGVDRSEQESTPEHSYYHHDDYAQSTPRAASQFENFAPPGNLVNQCLSDTYSSTTGLTFVHLRRVANNLATFSDCGSELYLSLTNNKHDNTNEMQNENRPPIIPPIIHIDDTNGSENLNMSKGRFTNTTNRQKTSIHAKNSETFFRTVQDRSEEIGMKIMRRKLSCCAYPLRGADTLTRM